MGERVFVSEVIGEGADAHRLVRVGAWELRAPESSSERETLVEDSELARHLGVRRNHLRELIRTYRNSEDIQPVTIKSAAPVKSRGRPGEGFRLTREDALFIVTRSNAPRAKALVKEMIRVFLAAMEGLLVPAGHLPPDQAEDLRREIDDLRANSLAGIIGEDRAAEVTLLLRVLSRLRARARSTKESSERRRAENELRNAVDFNGLGTDWPALPRNVLHKVLRVLRRWVKDARKECRRSGRPAPVVHLHPTVQLPLFRNGGGAA